MNIKVCLFSREQILVPDLLVHFLIMSFNNGEKWNGVHQACPIDSALSGSSKIEEISSGVVLHGRLTTDSDNLLLCIVYYYFVLYTSKG